MLWERSRKEVVKSSRKAETLVKQSRIMNICNYISTSCEERTVVCLRYYGKHEAILQFRAMAERIFLALSWKYMRKR